MLKTKSFITTTVISRLRVFDVDTTKIARLTNVIAGALAIDQAELGISFVSPATIKRLNQTYRAKNRATDVLSFGQQEWVTPAICGRKPKFKKSGFDRTFLGDIVISAENAERNARLIGHATDREVCFLLIHGFLHLCGHDHYTPKDERLMTAQQKKILQLVTSKRPLWSGCIRRRGKAERS